MGCGASFENNGLYSSLNKKKYNEGLTKILPTLRYQQKRPSSINTRIPTPKKFLVG